jgi:hypothetical protein
MSNTTSNERHKVAMRERNSLNLNSSGGAGQRACGPRQVKESDVTKTTNKPGKHPYDRK